MTYLDHRLSARRPTAVIAIVVIWLGLLALWIGLDAAWWIVLPLAVFTLPAVYEIGRGDVARLTLDSRHLAWKSHRASGNAPVQDIDYVRFDTRMDLAINARLVLVDGTVLRLPIECVPPYDAFCKVLDAAGLRHERHHFSFFSG